jgi:hypothetical protein
MSLACQDIPVTNMTKAFQRLGIKPGPAFQRRAIGKMHPHQFPFKRGGRGNAGSYALIAIQTGEHLGGGLLRKLEDIAYDTGGALRFIESAMEGAVAEKTTGHPARSGVAAAAVKKRGVGIRAANAK